MAAMQNLNLPVFNFRLRSESGSDYIFDEFRRRWVVLNPEEWVRQNFLKFLHEKKEFPKSLMAIEKRVFVNGLAQRFDLVVYRRNGVPIMVAEFKAPCVEIGQDTFDQAIRYNNFIKAAYVLVSNGITHYICKIDFKKGSAEYLNDIPNFGNL